MDNLRDLNDQDLILKIKALVKDERRITQSILDHLRLIESRRLFAKRGYSSLFDFCVRELGYSESSAQRRISAMRLIKVLPEAKEKLQSGEVNLSTLSQLSSFIRKEENLKNIKINHEDKKILLQTIENKSQRECEREFIKISPEGSKIKESQRPISAEFTEFKFTASKELVNKLEELKNLLAHQNKTHSLSELIEILSDKVLKTYKSKVVSKSTSAAAVKNEVWHRDQGRCQYLDPVTKRKCGSTYKIQVDHIIPKALQGKTSLNNLRLLCATHNQLSAIKIFSPKHMAQFVPGLEVIS